MRMNTEHGVIGLSNEALCTVVSQVAQSCFGVSAVGEKGGALAQLFRRETQPGVAVRPAEGGGIDIDLHIAVGYGVNLPAICRSITSEVRFNVAKLTGLPVASVSIYVDALRP